MSLHNVVTNHEVYHQLDTIEATQEFMEHHAFAVLDFTALVALRERVPERVALLLDYLDRHIELDGEHHTPLAFRMVSEICGDDNAKWHDVVDTATHSLQKRLALWDGVLETMVAVLTASDLEGTGCNAAWQVTQ
jgi:hypothetical protein